MPPKRADSPGEAPIPLPRLTRRPSGNTSTNGVENPIDPDAPREGRLASLKARPTPSTRGSASKITFKPKAVQRRRKDGASESLLNLGGNEDDSEMSGSHLRRAERGRGVGRGRGRGSRVEAPLQASGPFAQGPAMASVANARTRGTSSFAGIRSVGSSAPGRMAASTKKEKTGKSGQEDDDEANFDDAGQPMQNLLRMRDDTSDFWAPVTTERIERTQKEKKIALPGEAEKLVKVKKEAEDLGFIDVKTEPTESTLTSRVPSPELPTAGDTQMPDLEGQSPTGEIDDDDIALPGMNATAPAQTVEQKPKVEKQSKPVFKVMTAEEAEEQERLSTDLELLRMTLDRDPTINDEQEQLIFIQLPEVLPFWMPGQDDAKNDGFAKEEEVKHEIVEIDQIAEDRKFRKDQPANDSDPSDILLPTPESSKPREPAPVTTVPGGNVTVDSAKATAPENAATATELPKKKKKKPKPMTFPPPEGCIGQLHVHKSGRITCEWGGISMDVGTGSECGFLQEVVVVDTKTDKTAWSLGRVTSRMMMTPNLDDLLGMKG